MASPARHEAKAVVPGPVRSGSRVRGRFVLAKLDDIQDGIQMTWSITFEIEGVERPACVAEHVVRRFFRKN